MKKHSVGRRRSMLSRGGSLSLLCACIGVQPIGASASGGVTFSDIANSSGIEYRRGPSTTEVLWEAIKREGVFLVTEDAHRVPLKSRGAPGVALLDYDNDGDLDLYVTNGPGRANSLYRNQMSESGVVSFADVALEAGVDVTDSDSSGVCFGDIDNDGDHDLFVLAAGGGNSLFENRGKGRFRDITERAGVGGGEFYSASCSFGDVNGDGLLDVVVGNTYTGWENRIGVNLFAGVDRAEHNQLYINQGGNRFVERGAESGIQNFAGISWVTTLVDYDQDGDLDLFVADDQGPRAPAALGGLDLGYVRIYLNDGAGNFSDVTVAAGGDVPGAWMGLAFGDFDRDGHLDFFGSNGGDYVSDAMEQGPGFVDTLGPPPVIPPPHFSLTSQWFLGDGAGGFVAGDTSSLGRTPFGWGASGTDYDNDGDTDIVFHGGLDLTAMFDASNGGAMLNNDGYGVFNRDTVALAGSTDHVRRAVHGMAVGDLNNDGFTDIVSVSNQDLAADVPVIPFVMMAPPAPPSQFDVDASLWPVMMPVDLSDLTKGFLWSGLETLDGTVAVEMNNADNDNNWVKVRLVGATGVLRHASVNRDAIGAIVYFTPDNGEPRVMQPILGGSSYASQDSLTARFGLGEAERGTVEVLWPGGARSSLDNVRAGETIVFPEIPCEAMHGYHDRSARQYLRCVFRSLKVLERASLIDRPTRKRFMKNAIRAFRDHRS